MYIPSHFKQENEQVLLQFMKDNSFAILFSHVNGCSVATHIPLLVEADANGRRSLIGHLAKASPHANQLSGEALAVFHGPHAYISPTWYRESNNVPTWNYAAVHVYGMVRTCETSSEKLAVLDKMVAFYEASQPQPWSTAALAADYRDKLINALTAFRIEITRIEGKWNLNQNKSAAARAGVIESLNASPHAHERELAEMMSKL